MQTLRKPVRGTWQWWHALSLPEKRQEVMKAAKCDYHEACSLLGKRLGWQTVKSVLKPAPPVHRPGFGSSAPAAPYSDPESRNE